MPFLKSGQAISNSFVRKPRRDRQYHLHGNVLCEQSQWRARRNRFVQRCQSLSLHAIRYVSFFACALCLAPVANAASLDCPISPSITLSPQQVVETIIKALRDNDDDDNGIRTVFCFASPANRAQTGPLSRFTQMIKAGFGDMLNYSSSSFEPIQIREGTALQPVWLTASNGEQRGYLFTMGLQTEGPYRGMWMTDGVLPLRPDRQREQSI